MTTEPEQTPFTPEQIQTLDDAISLAASNIFESDDSLSGGNEKRKCAECLMRIHIIGGEALKILVPILVAGAVITAVVLLPFTIVLAPLLLVLGISLATLVLWLELARQEKVDAVSALARFLCKKKGDCV